MQKYIKHIGTGALLVTLLVAPVFVFAENNGKHLGHYKPSSVGSSIEVSITTDGKTIVRGARVIAVSDTTITAETLWNATSMTWTVRTDSDTNFIRKNGSGAGVGDISVGDYVSFSGQIASGSAFTVDADVVKNWSLSEDRTVVSGIITDLNDGSFELATGNRGTITVDISSSTDYSGGINEWSDLRVGAKVVAYGSYDDDSETLEAVQIAATSKAPHDKGNSWNWIKRIMPSWFSNR